MAKVATKKAEPATQADDCAPWSAVVAGAELYWGSLGRAAAEQIRDYALKLFDGEVKPAPIILGRPSRVHGQWAPLAQNQMRMHEAAIADTRAHSDIQPIKSISRAQLLRGVLVRHLVTCGKNPAPGSADWCSAAMAATLKLTGRKVWMAPQVERKVEVFEGESNYPRKRLVVEQARGPNGEQSLSWSDILSWPQNVVPDLGTISE